MTHRRKWNQERFNARDSVVESWRTGEGLSASRVTENCECFRFTRSQGIRDVLLIVAKIANYVSHDLSKLMGSLLESLMD